MLRWLEIQQFRNVVPGTRLDFGDGLHVVLGPNGGGKTTLLELISAALRGDFSAFAEEPFAIAYRIEVGGAPDALGVSIIHEAVAMIGEAQTVWSDTIEATVEREGRRIKIHINGGNLEVDGTTVGETSAGGRGGLHTALVRATSPSRRVGEPDPDNFTARRALRFDEGIGMFSFLLGRQAAPQGITLGVEFHALANGAGWKRLNISGFLVNVFDAIRNSFAPQQSRDLVLDLSALDRINEIVPLLGMKSLDARMLLDRVESNGDLEIYRYNRFEFWLTRRDGSRIRDEHFSFGQKRLLAFAFYAWANDGPLIADELADGMHYSWIEHCLDLANGRQAFISSQNPLLMDFVPFDSAQQVQETFVICDLREIDGRERMHWRTLGPIEAADFYAAYEVGIQHVSEILRTKGLW